MNKLLAFGDSFTWGSEMNDSLDYWDHISMIHDPSLFKHEHEIISSNNCGPYSEIDHEHKMTTVEAGYSKNTWTALLAKSLNKQYRCYAVAGGSNQTITRKLVQYLPNIDKNDSVIINWTYINRWDFVNPTKVPIDNQWETVRPINNNKSNFEKFYTKYIHNELWDKWNSLKEIMLAINILKSKKIKFLMTCNDKLILDDQYHCPSYIKNAQDEINDYIIWFEDMAFNDWCTKYNFPRGKENNHPLEEAHIAAFEYMKDKHDFT